MPAFPWNARGQFLIGGIPRLLTGIYDGGFAGASGTDMAGHVAARNYARYRFDVVNQIWTGGLGNGLRLADAVAPLGMYCLAIGNVFANFTIDDTIYNTAAPDGFDIQGNYTYTTSPEGTGPFQTLFTQKAGSFGTYHIDEVTNTASGHNGTNSLLNGAFPPIGANPGNLNNWTLTVTGGGTGTATWDAGNGGQAQLAGGTSTSVALSQSVSGLAPGNLYKLYFTIRTANVRVLVTGSGTLFDETLGPGNYYVEVTPTAATVTTAFSVLTGVTAQIDDVWFQHGNDGDRQAVVANNRFVNWNFPDNLASWAVTPLGGGTGTVVQFPPDRAQLRGGTAGVEFSQSVVVTASAAYRFYVTLPDGNVRVRLTSGASTLIDETPTGPGQWAWTVVPTTTSATATFSVAASVTAELDDVWLQLAANGHDQQPIPSLRGRDDAVYLYNFYKGAMPTMPVMGIIGETGVYQWIGWSKYPIGDVIGVDPYPVGTAPEIYPSNQASGESTHGYPNFEVAEHAACARYYCERYAGNGTLGGGVRVPLIVLQALKNGNASRFITITENLSHFAAGLTELRGAGMIWWWALGVQNGALDSYTFDLPDGTGSQTVFRTNSSYAEEAVDVRVSVGGVLQTLGTHYTLQNLGDTTLVRVGGNWTWANPVQVTFVTPPPVGVDNIRIEVNRWPTARRAAILQFLEDITKWVRLEQAILTTVPDDTLIVDNSTWQADFLTWRKSLVNLFRTGGADPVIPTFAGLQRYTDEWNRLNLATPDQSLSVHLDNNGQRGHVRTCAWSMADRAIISCHNMHPDPQVFSLTLSRPATRVQVLFEGRDATLSPDGLTITDTAGGGSSLRQGAFGMGHIYSVEFAAADNYHDWTNPTLELPTEIFDNAVVSGSGGSFAMHSGRKEAPGPVNATTVTHDSFRVAMKKIAFQGTADITAARSQARMDWVLR
jgi:hypothetical protein